MQQEEKMDWACGMHVREDEIGVLDGRPEGKTTWQGIQGR